MNDEPKQPKPKRPRGRPRKDREKYNREIHEAAHRLFYDLDLQDGEEWFERSRGWLFSKKKGRMVPTGVIFPRTWKPENPAYRRMTLGKLRQALEDSVTRIAPLGLTMVSRIEIDVDVHQVAASIVEQVEGEGRDYHVDGVVPDWEPTKKGARGRETRKRVSEAIAPDLIDVYEQLREEHPGVTLDRHRTPKGAHLVVKLAARVPVADAHAAGVRLVEGLVLPEQVRVEVFPKVRTDGRGDMCLAPLGGPSYRVQADFVTRDGKNKLEMIQGYLAAPRTDPTALGITATEPLVLPPETPPVELGTEIEISEEEWAHQAHGSRFAKMIESYLDKGIPNDGSYDAVRRLASACVYLDLDPRTAVDFFEAFVALDIHEGDQCRPRNRRSLVTKFKGCLRRQFVGVRKEQVKPGGMKAPRIRERMLALADSKGASVAVAKGA